MVPIGNIKKYGFSIEKKEHHYLDVVAKDQRRLKFKFESATTYFRMNDAMSRIVEITQHKDMFAFDYALKQRELNPTAEEGRNLFVDEEKVTVIAMREYDRMGVNSAPTFKHVNLDSLARIKFRIDLPSQVFIPSGLGPDDHLKCATARTHGRFPTLAYFNK